MDLRTWTENPVKNESKKKVLLSSERNDNHQANYPHESGRISC